MVSYSFSNSLLKTGESLKRNTLLDKDDFNILLQNIISMHIHNIPVQSLLSKYKRFYYYIIFLGAFATTTLALISVKIDVV